MTDTITDPTAEAPADDDTAASEATAEAETAAAEPVEDTEDTDKANPSREAAKYRKRLRETEAERDTLSETVNGLRRQLATAALADVLAKPEALWSVAGVEVADYFAEDGQLDVDRLRAAGKAAVAEHGLASYRRFQGGSDGGPRDTAPLKEDPWQKAASAITRSR